MINMPIGFCKNIMKNLGKVIFFQILFIPNFLWTMNSNLVIFSNKILDIKLFGHNKIFNLYTYTHSYGHVAYFLGRLLRKKSLSKEEIEILPTCYNTLIWALQYFYFSGTFPGQELLQLWLIKVKSLITKSSVATSGGKCQNQPLGKLKLTTCWFLPTASALSCPWSAWGLRGLACRSWGKLYMCLVREGVYNLKKKVF